MQNFKISFLTDKSPLSDSALLMQSDRLNISVLMLPRTQLDAVVANDMVTVLPQRGVYVLYGQQHIYVGKTNQGLDRIKQHDRSKDFWQVAVLFLSAAFDEEIIAGLEAETIAHMQQHSQFVLENKQIPQHQYAHKQTEINVKEWLQQLQNVLGFLARNPVALAQTQMAAMPADNKQKEWVQGQVAQQQSQVNLSTTEPELVFTLRSGDARMVQLPDERVKLLRGAKININSTYASIIASTKHLYEILLKHGLINKDTGELLCDMTFSCASAAGRFVLGRACSGLEEWRDAQGRSFKEVASISTSKDTEEESDAAESAAQSLSANPEDIPAQLRGVLIFQSSGLTARMSYRGEKQWVVLAGSLLRGADRKDDRLFVQNTISEAKENNTITEQADGYLKTSVDFSFSTPSAAMAFVYGSGVGAFDKWRNEAGVTLRELLAQAEVPVTADAAADAAIQPQATATEEIPEQLRGVLLFQARNLTAKMSFRGVKQWVVLSGSQLRGADRKDTQVSTRQIIAEAKKRHELTEQADGSFVINRDFYCKTPSAALALVLGGEGTDALTHWHNEDGVTLRALLAQAELKEY